MDQPPSQSSPVAPTPDEPEWRRVLSGTSPRDVLAKLVEGDPLRLRERCESRLRAQAILLDEHRLRLRTMALVARHALTYTGSPPIEIWLNEQLRRAVRELVQESTELLATGTLPSTTPGDRLMRLARVLGIDPLLLGRACAEFNRAPYEARTAFFGLVIDGSDPAEWCLQNSTTPERARSALRSALWALGVREDLDLDSWFRGGDHRD